MEKLMPESSYTFTLLDREQITQGRTVTGFVEKILPDQQIVQVRLGVGLIATMPFSEATMYPLRLKTDRLSAIPTNVLCLFRQTVRVKVVEITEDSIIVSRKANMQQAYEQLKAIKHTRMYILGVIAKTAFGDIGEGVVGKLFINEVCHCHVNDVRDFFSKGQTIDVVLLEPDDEQRFSVSYKQTYKPYCQQDYHVGMTVSGKVMRWIEITTKSKYFVYITPQVSGILTINHHQHIDYGTAVECVVTGVGDKGLFLELSKIV